jgi:hypothetical protein
MEISYIYKLYKLYDEPCIVKVIDLGRLRWLMYLFGIQKQNSCRKVTLYKPEGARRAGRPAITWLYSVEEGVKKMNLETKATGLGPMASNLKGQSSSWIVALAEEQFSFIQRYRTSICLYVRQIRTLLDCTCCNYNYSLHSFTSRDPETCLLIPVSLQTSYLVCLPLSLFTLSLLFLLSLYLHRLCGLVVRVSGY